MASGSAERIDGLQIAWPARGTIMRNARPSRYALSRADFRVPGFPVAAFFMNDLPNFFLVRDRQLFTTPFCS